VRITVIYSLDPLGEVITATNSCDSG